MNAKGGLANVIDIVIAPSAAFERLRVSPVWGWAFLVATLLGIAGSLLAQPAILHAVEQSIPAQLAANPSIASLPPDKQQEAIVRASDLAKVFVRFAWIFFPLGVLLTGLVQSLVMLIANAITKSEGTFAKFYALNITIAIIGGGLNTLVIGVITEIRGVTSFDDPSAIGKVIPGLATLVPGAHGALSGFLTAFSVFYLWAVALQALGMIAIAKMPRIAAWATAIILLLLFAATQAIAARQG